MLANKPATLVYLANQGCITPAPWPSRADEPDHPDRLIFDLDPSGDDFGKVQRRPALLRALLDDSTARYVQTTGSRGLHVVVPLDRATDFDDARAFARAVAGTLRRVIPTS